MSHRILGWVLPIPPFFGLWQAHMQVGVVGQDQSVDLGKTCPPIYPQMSVSMDLSEASD
jgi:hypothetical protein